MSDHNEKFETTFQSESGKFSFKLNLGLESVPSEVKSVDPLHLVAYVLMGTSNVVARKLVFEKSRKFIFLNKDTDKYNLIDLERDGSDSPIELPGPPTVEQLAESFFVNSVTPV